MHNSTQEVIGIIGDGQLALMLAEALTKFEIPYLCLASSEKSPMMRLFPTQTTMDAELFQRSCSRFTLENEFLETQELQLLLKNKTNSLFPDMASYSHFSDKLSQRTLFDTLGINSPCWMALTNLKDLKDLSLSFSFPFVLKASQGGYDGKGVRVINSQEELQLALKDFGFNQGRSLLVEEKVNIKSELAQGFVADERQSTLLPLVHTVQESGVCNFVYYPAQVDDSIKRTIEEMLKKLINYPLRGIFNFEFFVTTEDKVFINEGAPRPHNSQHLTIDASNFSQFELLAMYLAHSSKIPETITTTSSAMINLLGQSTGPDYKLELPEVEGVKVEAKLYGKERCLPGRKMGHVNIIDETGELELKKIAEKIFKEYRL